MKKTFAIKDIIKLIFIELVAALFSVGIFYIINLTSELETMPTLLEYIFFGVVALIIPITIMLVICIYKFTTWISNKITECIFKKNTNSGTNTVENENTDNSTENATNADSESGEQRIKNKHNNNSSIIITLALGIFVTSLISSLGSKVAEFVCEVIKLISNNKIDELIKNSYVPLTLIALSYPSLCLLGIIYERLCDSIMEIYKIYKKATAELMTKQ